MYLYIVSFVMKFFNLEESDEKTGRWNQTEHQSFIEAIKAYGKNWKLVADHIGTRNSTQVRSHAQKYFLREHTRQTIKKQAKEFFDKAQSTLPKVEKKDAITQYGEGVSFSNLSLMDCMQS